MKILVAYASKHSSTKGIADFLGEKLKQKGNDVDVVEVKIGSDLGKYDAFVIGSAVYMGHWIKDAREFVSKNKNLLSRKPVWLFSSGPVGNEPKDKQGRDLREVSGPNEINELKEQARPREHHVFFGTFDPKDLDFFSRQFFKSSAIRNATPIGDFRDWKEIESWANSIASELQKMSMVAT